MAEMTAEEQTALEEIGLRMVEKKTQDLIRQAVDAERQAIIKLAKGYIGLEPLIAEIEARGKEGK